MAATKPKVDLAELSAAIATREEWLAVTEASPPIALRRSEIELAERGNRALIGIVDQNGFRLRRLTAFTLGEREIEVEIEGDGSSVRETMRLVPRTPASELTAAIELARLMRANAAAEALEQHFTGLTRGRVEVEAANGRIARIFLADRGRRVRVAAICDVSEMLGPESLLTHAVVLLEKLQRRKKDPVDELCILGPRKRMRPLQRLLAALRPGYRSGLRVFEWMAPGSQPGIKELRPLTLRDVFRRKHAVLKLEPPGPEGEALRWIESLAPDETDTICSARGRTIRFMGLPFARVRTTIGREMAWFGTGKAKRLVTSESAADLIQLVEELRTQRTARPVSTRNEFYRVSPESWLEAILRRNIKLLDSNLILSPIYNQFRTSTDRIDLLALRRDGRLVIIELKASPDREMPFQAADYWLKVEHQRRRGELARARLFGDIEIADRPAMVYAVAPALAFHRDFHHFARMLAHEIELWQFALHNDWRNELKVVARVDHSSGATNL